MSFIVGRGMIGPAATDEHAISLASILNAMGWPCYHDVEVTWDNINQLRSDLRGEKIPPPDVWRAAVYRLHNNDLTPIMRDKSEERFVVNGYIVSFLWNSETQNREQKSSAVNTVDVIVDDEFYDSFTPVGIDLEDTSPGSYRARINDLLTELATNRPPLWAGVSCPFVVYPKLLGENVHYQLVINLTSLLKALDYDVVFSREYDENTNRVTHNGAIPTLISPEDWKTCLWMLRERIAIPPEDYLNREIYCVNGHLVEIGSTPVGNRSYFTESDKDSIIYPLFIDGTGGYRLLIPVTNEVFTSVGIPRETWSAEVRKVLSKLAVTLDSLWSPTPGSAESAR
ncbi:MAG: hypothetical protein FWE76_00590 [Symbiobacteriaceae bacterium]|nr:hypothetical protein [Symbiobacteriaceae bacterium]